MSNKSITIYYILNINQTPFPPIDVGSANELYFFSFHFSIKLNYYRLKKHLLNAYTYIYIKKKKTIQYFWFFNIITFAVHFLGFIQKCIKLPRRLSIKKNNCHYLSKTISINYNNYSLIVIDKRIIEAGDFQDIFIV